MSVAPAYVLYSKIGNAWTLARTLLTAECLIKHLPTPTLPHTLPHPIIIPRTLPQTHPILSLPKPKPTLSQASTIVGVCPGSGGAVLETVAQVQVVARQAGPAGRVVMAEQTRGHALQAYA